MVGLVPAMTTTNTVIASAAKQSILTLPRDGLLRRFAPRNDDPLNLELRLGYLMRLRIAHSTSYRYEPPATGVIQILRMTPGSHDGQYVAEWQIDVSTDSRLDVHQDAFGNVTHVLTHGPIADLTITVEGLIETHDTGGVLRGTD
jgi:hypothetical protein